MISWKTKINYITDNESLSLFPLFSLLPLTLPAAQLSPPDPLPRSSHHIGEAAVGIRGEQCELEALLYFLHSQF